jgi:hypothetical protein
MTRRGLWLAALTALVACRPSAVASTGTTTVTVAGDPRPLQIRIEPMREGPLVPLQAQQNVRCGANELLAGVDLALPAEPSPSRRALAFRLRCVEVGLTAGAVTYGAERVAEWRSLSGGPAEPPGSVTEGVRCPARTAAVDLSIAYTQGATEPRRGLAGVLLHCANVACQTTGGRVVLWGEVSATPSTLRGDGASAVVACGGAGDGPIAAVATGMAFVPEGDGDGDPGAVGPLCSLVSLAR